jgi:high-affinity K+ transport system ATPase subunit B
LKIGKKMNVSDQGARRKESARRTYLETLLSHSQNRPRIQKRLTPEEIKARLILFIGMTLSIVFLIVTLGITYALIFVTQPVSAQAPNDAAFIDLLKTLAIFLTGSLGGVLASNGLKDKTANDTPKITPNP